MNTANSIVKLIQIIGSPFEHNDDVLDLKGVELKVLYRVAKENRVPMLYLTKVMEKYVGKKPIIANEYQRYRKRMVKLIKSIKDLAKILGNLENIDYVFIKTLKPFPHVPSDIDVLIYASDSEGKEKLVKRLLKQGYKVDKTAYTDPRSIHLIDRYGNLIDMQFEIGADYIIYVDKCRIKKHIRRNIIVYDDISANVLSPEAELVITIGHSVIPEQTFTLNEFYSILYYINNMHHAEIDKFISAVVENKLSIATKICIHITKSLYENIFGYVPDKLAYLAKALNINAIDFIFNKLCNNVTVLPCRYSVFFVLWSILEKIYDKKGLLSILKQIVSFMNPMHVKLVLQKIAMIRSRGE